MPRILEMKKIDGKLAVFLDMPPDEVSPVHMLTDAELETMLQEEREACAQIAEDYTRDDHGRAIAGRIRART